MAISFQEDVIAGSEISENENGFIVQRVFRVKDIPVEESYEGATDVGYRALLALQGAHPDTAYAGPHPRIPGLRVSSRRALPVLNSKSQMTVVLGYLDTSIVRVRIGGVTTQEMTSLDTEGNLMVVRFNPQVDSTIDPAASFEGTLEMTAEVPVLRPGLTLEYFWSNTDDTNEHAKWFTACTNAQTWNGGAPQTWICEQYGTDGQIVVGAQLRGRPIIWNKHAFFRYRGPTETHVAFRDSHERMILWRDPYTRKIHPSIDPSGFLSLDSGPQSGNGWRVSSTVPFVNYDELNYLPQVFNVS